MNEEYFDELAGRVEALTRTVMSAIAILEDSEVIDGPRLTKGLRQEAGRLEFDRPHLESTQRTLREISDVLDAARKHRQSLVH